MGFMRYQQIGIEARGRRREMPPGLTSTVRSTLISGEAGSGFVEIINPSSDSVSLLRELGAVVDVVAGYLRDGPVPATILRGAVVRGSVEDRFHGPDRVVSCHVVPGDVRAGPVAPKAWSRVTAREAIRHVVDSAGIELGSPIPGPGREYREGFVVGGPALKSIATLARDSGWRWATTHGALRLWPDDSSLLLVPDVRPDTGLIETPVLVDDGSIRFRCQLRPDIVPGVSLVIESSVLSEGRAQVVISAVDIEATSTDGPFETVAEGEILATQ